MNIPELKKILRSVRRVRPRWLYRMQTKIHLYKRAAELREDNAFAFFMRQFQGAIATSLAFVLVFSSSGYAYASTSVTEGDVLYPVKRGLESVRLGMTFNSRNRAAFMAQLSDRRVDEIVHMIENDDHDFDDAAVVASLDDVSSFSDRAILALGEVDDVEEIHTAIVRVQDRIQKSREKLTAMRKTPPERVLLILQENDTDLNNIRPSVVIALREKDVSFRLTIPRQPEVFDLRRRVEYQLTRFIEDTRDLPDALPAVSALEESKADSVGDGGAGGDSAVAGSVEAVGVIRDRGFIDEIRALERAIRAALESDDVAKAHELMRDLQSLIHRRRIRPKRDHFLQPYDATPALPKGFELLPESPVDPDAQESRQKGDGRRQGDRKNGTGLKGGGVRDGAGSDDPLRGLDASPLPFPPLPGPGPLPPIPPTSPLAPEFPASRAQ